MFLCVILYICTWYLVIVPKYIFNVGETGDGWAMGTDEPQILLFNEKLQRSLATISQSNTRAAVGPIVLNTIHKEVMEI